MQTHLQQVLFDFGNAIGLDGLQLDDNGTCHLKFENIEIHLLATEHTPEAMLYGSIAQFNDLYLLSSDFLLRLLALNHGQLGTQGATVGIHHETGEVLLSRRFSTTNLEVGSLEKILESFIQVFEHIDKFINNYKIKSDDAVQMTTQTPTDLSFNFIRG